MFSPAIFRVCCLAVMAPALTKAVRQADSLTHLLMPQKNLASKIDQLCIDDRTAALNGPGKSPRAYKGGSVNNGSILSNGNTLHFKQFAFDRPLGNSIKQLNANGLKNGILNSNPKTVNNVNGHYSYVGGLSPAYESGEITNKMNEETVGSDEKMGLLNANTSLESDIQAKSFSHQCLSPASSNMSPRGSEFVKDIPTKSPVESILSPLGSPKSASGESTSTVTTHNPQVVTFAELQEAKQTNCDLTARSQDLMARLRKLQMLRLEGHMSGQLKALVSHYQRTLSIPCQRPQRQNMSRRVRDPVELKAGVPHSESSRSSLTAALINLVRTIESSDDTPFTSLQVNKGSSEVEDAPLGGSREMKLKPEECQQVKRAVGSMLVYVSHLEVAIDSDATESSGSESCDEYAESEDKKTSYTPVNKGPSWVWATERAPIAKRWTWLQSQVQDLEYKIRQFADLLVQARKVKGEISFEEPVQIDSASKSSTMELHPTVSYTDQSLLLKKAMRSLNGCLSHTSSAVIGSAGLSALCGVPSSTEACPSSLPQCGTGQTSGEECNSASRTRPRVVSSFRKRKLLRTSALHVISKKAARLASVKCNCDARSDVMPCILCGGRYNSTQTVNPSMMPLLERVALLQPTFHPILSQPKDISTALHFESHLRKNEKYYKVSSPLSFPIKKEHYGLKHKGLLDHARHHSRKLTKHAAQTLLTSERYKNSRHSSHNSSRLHSRSLALKKWRSMQRGPFKKSWSVASNCSSRQESPVHSPSAFEDGFLLNSIPGKHSSWYDFFRRRRDDFDIDNVIVPYSMRTSVKKLECKEIVTPKFRLLDSNTENDPEGAETDAEDVCVETLVIRHEKAEVEERNNNLRISAKIGGGLRAMRGGGRRRFYDSRADSSGANTPDHMSFYPQEILFGDSNSLISGGPSSPAFSPPATPGSLHMMSDDSQPASVQHTPSTASSERKRTISWHAPLKREKSEESSALQAEVFEVQPFEPRNFPISDEEYQEMVLANEEVESVPVEEEAQETVVNEPSSPESMDTSSSTSSAFEDEDDETADPEWTVVQRQNEPNRTLVLKLAKR